ncbi:hypothetical protein NEOLEDRAFT_1184755 [Neolentinus lepideus HHB14362 ss-1]|uniref:Uncharacterized protein n=1 Tax=Neolentinus lepideus HHB14362 ss-1 TaxID=1314782 RepID=A0A165M6L6_9AGAM|nr:hypothetical protein NEOLEDRAFT_1184755 [Neolentinus lepideus HHB14362 ss-1]
MAQNAQEASVDVEASANVVEYAGKASVALSASDRSSWLSALAAANWNTNTGATSHMTPHRHWFASYSPHIIPVRLANDTIIYTAGMGSVIFEPVLGGSKAPVVVLHDVLHVPQLGSNLFKLVFTASVNDRNTGYLNGRTVVSPSQSASLADACPLDLALWHRRLSHVNLDYLQRMKQKQLVQGLVIRSSSILDPICEPCITVVSDLKGPLIKLEACRSHNAHQEA